MTDDEIKTAREAVARDRVEREKKCMDEIQQILKQYSCTLDVLPQSVGQLLFQFGIVVRSQ